jgi:hypothetical protein
MDVRRPDELGVFLSVTPACHVAEKGRLAARSLAKASAIEAR